MSLTYAILICHLERLKMFESTATTRVVNIFKAQENIISHIFLEFTIAELNDC